MRRLKPLVKQALGPKVLGMLDYYRFPERRESWGGPFNAQQGRVCIFNALCDHLDFSAIVETGTFRGTTTKYMAGKSGVPVFTVERDARLFGFAKMRFTGKATIKTVNSDSRVFLRTIIRKEAMENKTTLFYLDAHWGDDLPLCEELEIIFGTSDRAVVMIDDFKVPDDPGYTYDDYGEGIALTPEYIAPVVDKYRLSHFYPSAGSEVETGACRGCVVLANNVEILHKINDLQELRS